MTEFFTYENSYSPPTTNYTNFTNYLVDKGFLLTNYVRIYPPKFVSSLVSSYLIRNSNLLIYKLIRKIRKIRSVSCFYEFMRV